MNTSFCLFPVLTEELLSKIGFQASNYFFEYTRGNSKRSLTAKPVDAEAYRNEYIISDEKSEWTADKYNLRIERNYEIYNPQALFGPHGVAPLKSELGLALIWTSKTSNQRGTWVISGFKCSKKPLDMRMKQEFYVGQLRGVVKLQTVLYLKDPMWRNKNEFHLANNAGTILGILDEFTIIIDGKGSVFPIVETSEASQPLWWVRCDWSDPQEDSFDQENVAIYLNKAHKNYNLLDLDKGLTNSPVLVEIVASALQIIVQKVKEDNQWHEIVNGNNLLTGSIAMAVNYFINTFSWDFNSPEKLALTIRQDIEKRMGGI